jgi:hypothetical protein
MWIFFRNGISFAFLPLPSGISSDPKSKNRVVSPGLKSSPFAILLGALCSEAYPSCSGRVWRSCVNILPTRKRRGTSSEEGLHEELQHEASGRGAVAGPRKPFGDQGSLMAAPGGPRHRAQADKAAKAGPGGKEKNKQRPGGVL